MKISPIQLHKIPDFDEEFVPPPGGIYVPVNVRANIAYVAIQFPIDRHGDAFKGLLGADVSTQEGLQAARKAAMNVISQINRFVGFENVEGLNHFDMYYLSTSDWDEAPMVANSASDLFVNALRSKGIHTRAIFGVHALPRNFCVGITASFTLL